jgi:hypothetical protein
VIIHGSRGEPPWLNFKTRQLPAFNLDPDPAFYLDAEPNPASENDAIQVCASTQYFVIKCHFVSLFGQIIAIICSIYQEQPLI